MKKNLWIWAVAGAMALPQIGFAQFGPKPGQPQPGKPQPGKPQQPPVVVVKPAPQPKPQPNVVVVKPVPQPPKPQPTVVVKPVAPQPPPKPQPPVVVKPTAPQPPPKPQPAVVVKPVQTPPPKPQPPVVVKPEAPKPPVEYRPGHKNHPLRDPREREHYKDWHVLRHKQYYKLTEAPEQLQVSMRVGQEIEFKLEERVGDGYKWFARFNPVIVDVDVDHERPHWYQFGRKTHSEVEIEGRRPGNTMVELVYARPDEWDRGVDPQKVVQIFVHIE